MSRLPRDNEHVAYEFAMLDAVYITLQQRNLPSSLSQQFWINVLHESFCVHAWNLIGWIVEDTNDPFVVEDKVDGILEKIADQILSLGTGRTALFEEKLKDDDRTFIYHWIMQYDHPTTDNSVD